MNGPPASTRQSARAQDETLSGVVIYQDQTTRDRAIRLCDHLMQTFWADLTLNFSWWKFDYLSEPRISRLAADATAGADLVIFSTHAGRELPPHVESWIESWLQRRENRTAALVALVGLAADPFKGITPIHTYLRDVAQRARMDYLPQIIEDPACRMSASVENITNRAEKVTSVLDDILHHAPVPPRWGINE